MEQDESTSSGSPKKRPKLNHYQNEPLQPATAEDRAKWPGFCEIESDPNIFNMMLNRLGVDDIKVDDMWGGLDPEFLANLPRPVYGVILCAEYSIADPAKQELTCPPYLWFANQVHDNLCGTLALLNILNNIPRANLGSHLQPFKDFTQDFSPTMRGVALGNFDFLRQIHNSSARKMDMLSIDLALCNKIQSQRNKQRTSKARKSRSLKGNGKKRNSGLVPECDLSTEDDFDLDEAANHYVAYVPVQGEIWRLDGLDYQPQKIAAFDSSDDWLATLGPILQDQMMLLDVERGGSLMCVLQNPLVNHREELAANVSSLTRTERQLDSASMGWRAKADELGMSISSDTILEHKNIATSNDTELMNDVASDKDTNSDDAIPENRVKLLLGERTRLALEQARLRAVVRDEINKQKEDQAETRFPRHDYGPFIHTWLGMLAERDGLLKGFIEETKAV